MSAQESIKSKLLFLFLGALLGGFFSNPYVWNKIFGQPTHTLVEEPLNCKSWKDTTPPSSHIHCAPGFIAKGTMDTGELKCCAYSLELQ